jgi:hypothetical protein
VTGDGVTPEPVSAVLVGSEGGLRWVARCATAQQEADKFAAVAVAPNDLAEVVDAVKRGAPSGGGSNVVASAWK